MQSLPEGLGKTIFGEWITIPATRGGRNMNNSGKSETKTESPTTAKSLRQAVETFRAENGSTELHFVAIEPTYLARAAATCQTS
jgi:hypothetical protein